MSQHLEFLLRWVTLGLAIAFLVLIFRGNVPLSDSSGNSASGRVDSYAEAVALAAPAVVNIYATKLIAEPRPQTGSPLAERFMGMSPTGRPRHRLEQSLGSAVIVTDDGYMLTNHHVISAAVEIQAVLWDGRIARAEIWPCSRSTAATCRRSTSRQPTPCASVTWCWPSAILSGSARP
jgi:serine protease DegS/serine protease DegQ